MRRRIIADRRRRIERFRTFHWSDYRIGEQATVLVDGEDGTAHLADEQADFLSGPGYAAAEWGVIAGSALLGGALLAGIAAVTVVRVRGRVGGHGDPALHA